MTKKTKKETREVLVEDVFLDRDKARKEFWNRYEMVDKAGDFQIVMYYGLGGMGKTSLLHEIEREIEDKKINAIWEHYDFSDGHDPVTVLKTISKDLKEKYKFSFPVLSYALYSYYLKCGEDPNSPEVDKIIDDIPFLRESFALCNVIPGVGSITEPLEYFINKLSSTVHAQKKAKIREYIERINNATKEKIHDDIPLIFVNELNENLDKYKSGRPVFILMFDTYERLVNELSLVGTPKENDLWLRDDVEGILLRIDKLLCVFAGRETLKWSESDPDWDNEVLAQIEIDTLDTENSKNLLQAYGITDKQIIAKICKVTQGVPLYLDICIDIYNNAKSSGKEISPDLFENKIDKMAQKLMTYMDDAEKDVLYLLSCLGRWSSEEFYEINRILDQNSVNASIYNKVLELTFVRKDENSYFIHQTMQEILARYCPRSKIMRFVKAMRCYIESENKFSNKYFKYAYLISKICRIRNDEELTNWWYVDASNILENYLDSFYIKHFLEIYEELPKFASDYKLKTLYLRYLLKISDYENALKFYEENIPDTNNDKDALDYKLTASYYYYINGKDEEALRMREEVYQERSRLFGESDIHTVRAGLALAASYSRIGKHEESIKLGNTCRGKLKNIKGFDSTISAAQNQLGDSYFRVGDYKKALVVYQDVFSERSRWLGEKNNSTMIAYNHIADCLTNLGDYERALSIYNQVRQIREKELSKNKDYCYVVNGENKMSHDHPDTIIVDNNKAVCLIYMKRYDEAVRILKEVVAKRKATLAPDAPATMGALENLAICEFYTNSKCNAIEHISIVLKNLQKVYPNSHYEVALAKYHKALIEENEEEIQRAIDEYTESLSYNSVVLSRMKEHRFIGYFSLGRYYE